jgi:hypothetical protein
LVAPGWLEVGARIEQSGNPVIHIAFHYFPIGIRFRDDNRRGHGVPRPGLTHRLNLDTAQQKI